MRQLTSARPYHPIRQRVPLVGQLVNWLIISVGSVLLLNPLAIDWFTVGGVYVAEIPIAIFATLVYLKPDLRLAVSRTIRERVFAVGAVWLFLMLILGFFVTNDLVAAYGDFRACLAGLFALAFLSRLKSLRSTEVDLYIVAILVQIPFSLYSFVHSHEGIQVGQSVKNSSNILSAVSLTFIGCERRSWRLFLSGVIASVGFAVISFYRVYWLTVGVGFLVWTPLLVYNMARRGAIVKSSALLLVLTLTSVMLIPIVGSYLNSSESNRIQSVNKTTELVQLLTGEGKGNSSDRLRAEYLKVIATDLPEFSVPRGLGSRAYFGQVLPDLDNFTNIKPNTADSGFFFIMFHFGLLVGLGVVFLSIKRVIEAGRRDSTVLMRVGGLGSALLYIIASGDVFTVIQKAVFFGGFLGLLMIRQSRVAVS